MYRLNESSDDTMTPTYIDTFEDTTTNTTTKKTPRSKSQPSSKSPLEKLRHYTLGKSPHTSPRSLFNTRSHTRNSESESEDSISLTGRKQLLFYLYKMVSCVHLISFGEFFFKLDLGQFAFTDFKVHYCIM